MERQGRMGIIVPTDVDGLTDPGLYDFHTRVVIRDNKFPESTLTDQFLVPSTTLVSMQLPLLFLPHPPALPTYLLSSI